MSRPRSFKFKVSLPAYLNRCDRVSFVYHFTAHKPSRCAGKAINHRPITSLAPAIPFLSRGGGGGDAIDATSRRMSWRKSRRRNVSIPGNQSLPQKSSATNPCPGTTRERKIGEHTTQQPNKPLSSSATAGELEDGYIPLRKIHPAAG
ncbi:tudor and KH domain-containing protein [Anopheles sinensis]|uniref:Tudor and KH domain-containing protein n=1 Tax=Anopheles sinensis TaxID=74873 RepID=A0A084VEX9_ANOSI|nr:tudor and KH domain-containing protein [Anopheles sinensis]